MINTDFGLNIPYTADQILKRTIRSKFMIISFYVALATFIGSMMIFLGTSLVPIAWLALALVLFLIVYQPRSAIYLVTMLTVVGDGNLNFGYPFNVNFSSSGSLLFVSDSLIISPIEVCIGLAIISWLIQGMLLKRLEIQLSSTLVAGAIFMVFVVTGLLYGVGVNNGDLNIALWQSRPMFYMAAMLFLTSQLISEEKHVMNFLWAAFIGMAIEGLFAYNYIANTLEFEISRVETIVNHSAAIHINLYLIFIICIWLFQKTTLFSKFTPFILFIPIMVTYIGAQRRTAYLTLAICMCLAFILLYFYRRVLLWFVAPPAILLGVAYLGIFWNVQGPAGLPAQAVKSVIAEDQASAKDQSSNLYRETENLNSEFTIKLFPLTGVGFGNKFIIIYPLPDISSFEWWEYFTHNSIIWMWMQTGVFGFVSMLYLFAISILVGIRAIVHTPDGDLRVAAIAILSYLIMHYIFAYADISWDNQSLVLVGAGLGIVNRILWISEKKAEEASELESLQPHSA